METAAEKQIIFPLNIPIKRTEQSCSWETDSCSDYKDIPCTLIKPVARNSEADNWTYLDRSYCYQQTRLPYFEASLLQSMSRAQKLCLPFKLSGQNVVSLSNFPQNAIAEICTFTPKFTLK
jgi:hypothetical protein